MTGNDRLRLELPRGTMLGKFEVLRRIATGGMAEIYLARLRGRAGFEKLVVIKRILPAAAANPRLIQMFLDEARLVATLQHPNIADVYEVGEYEGSPFFAMEHVHGQDVRSIRKTANERQQGVPLRVSLAIVQATASALDYAHNRSDPNGTNLNLVHRDVSPSNIVVSYEGAIKLIDFGVARVTSQSHTTQSGTVRGKCPYMSPEQCRGLPLDRRSDLFSLGTVLYELTTGHRPFVGASDFEIMNHIVNQDARRPLFVTEGYPSELEWIVMKLLTRDPVRRYQTAEDVLHDLERFLDAKHLWIPPNKISRYMRTLFADRLAAWEEATQGDGTTFAELAALSMEPEYRRLGQDTPPTPVPVVMRLAQEIDAVAADADASLAQVYRSDDPNDPLRSILGPLDASVPPSGSGDTITVRTGESDVLEQSVAQPSGDTITERTGEPDMHDSIIAPSGDTVTTPWQGVRPVGDTVLNRRDTTEADDTTTVRADRDRSDMTTNPLEKGIPRLVETGRTFSGWVAPSAAQEPAPRVSREAARPTEKIDRAETRPYDDAPQRKPFSQSGARGNRRFWIIVLMIVLAALAAAIAIIYV